VAKGRQTLQRLLTGPITFTPTAEGFEFSGLSSFVGWDSQLRAIVTKNDGLAGRIDRRSKGWWREGWWPRPDTPVVTVDVRRLTFHLAGVLPVTC
jgi:hypothetical protein